MGWVGGGGRKGKEYRGPGHKFTEANGSAFFSFLIFIILELFFFAFEAVVLRAINWCCQGVESVKKVL